MKTQTAPLPGPSTNLRGEQMLMSGLDTTHRQFSNTPEDKFQDQWTMIQSMWTGNSIINNSNMITKTPNNNTLLIIYQMDNENLYPFDCSLINS